MESTDMTSEQNIRTFIEDLINEIIATAVGTIREENTAIGAVEEVTEIEEDG